MVQRKSVSVWEKMMVCFDWLFGEITCITNLRCGAPEGMDGKSESTTTHVVALQDWEKQIQNHVKVKGQKKCYHRKGGGSAMFGRGIIVYFILWIHFFGSLFLLLLVFAFAVFCFFNVAPCAAFAARSVFFLVRLSLLLFFCLCTLRCSGRFWCFTPHFEAAAQEKEWTFCVWGGGAAPSPPTPSSFEMLKVIA